MDIDLAKPFPPTEDTAPEITESIGEIRDGISMAAWSGKYGYEPGSARVSTLRSTTEQHA